MHSQNFEWWIISMIKKHDFQTHLPLETFFWLQQLFKREIYLNEERINKKIVSRTVSKFYSSRIHNFGSRHKKCSIFLFLTFPVLKRLENGWWEGWGWRLDRIDMMMTKPRIELPKEGERKMDIKMCWRLYVWLSSLLFHSIPSPSWTFIHSIHDQRMKGMKWEGGKESLIPLPSVSFSPLFCSSWL